MSRGRVVAPVATFYGGAGTDSADVCGDTNILKSVEIQTPVGC